MGFLAALLGGVVACGLLAGFAVAVGIVEVRLGSRSTSPAVASGVAEQAGRGFRRRQSQLRCRRGGSAEEGPGLHVDVDPASDSSAPVRIEGTKARDGYCPRCHPPAVPEGKAHDGLPVRDRRARRLEAMSALGRAMERAAQSVAFHRWAHYGWRRVAVASMVSERAAGG